MSERGSGGGDTSNHPVSHGAAGGGGGPVLMSAVGAGGSTERMRELEIGIIGKFLGSGEQAKSHIGFIIVLCLCVLLGLSMFLPVSGGSAGVFPARLSAITGGLGYILETDAAVEKV